MFVVAGRGGGMGGGNVCARARVLMCCVGQGIFDKNVFLTLVMATMWSINLCGLGTMVLLSVIPAVTLTILINVPSALTLSEMIIDQYLNVFTPAAM